MQGISCATELPGNASDIRHSKPEQWGRQLTNTELVSRCTDRSDEVAWLEFVRRFQPVIAITAARTARRWTNLSSALVDDLVQMTYLKLCSNQCKALREPVWKHENSIYGFLKIVAANTTQDYFCSRFCWKRSGKQIEESVETSETALALATPRAHHGEQWVLIDQIQKILRSIVSGPNADRDMNVFWLYYRQGLTASEISALPGMNLSIKGIESILHRFTRMLRGKLNPKRDSTLKRIVVKQKHFDTNFSTQGWHSDRKSPEGRA